jgi:ferrochelatase
MKRGLLLINIGTPENPDTASVRRYLRVFFSDKRVIDLPALLRYVLVYGIILPLRPRRTAKAYQSIWTKQGSPLLHLSMQLVQQLQMALDEKVQVALGMRYGEPSIDVALNTLSDCDEITILPLFPQYASAVTGSALEYVLPLLAKKTVVPALKVINEFYQHPAFIKAQAACIKPFLNHEHILFSYHGLPERHLEKIGCNPVCRNEACPPISAQNNTCYRAQCYATTKLLVEALHIEPSKYTTSFQSRLGKTPWIEPFTDTTLEMLASKGIKQLAVVCPSFVTDCLETLEEIGLRAKEQWIKAGGHSLDLVPCMNASQDWVQALTLICADE